jgi:metal-responsive CopG/Arc/MetJ family transcriptional regulator
MAKVTIRIDLEGELADSFLRLKRNRGIKNNSELVRMLVTEEYKRTKATGD